MKLEITGVDARGAIAWVKWARDSVQEFARQLQDGKRSTMVLPGDDVRGETWRFFGELNRQARAALGEGLESFTFHYEVDPDTAKTGMRTHAQFRAFVQDLQDSGEFDLVMPEEAAAAANHLTRQMGYLVGLSEKEIPRF